MRVTTRAGRARGAPPRAACIAARLRVVVATAASIAILTAVACGDSDANGGEDTANVCANLDDVQSSLIDLLALDPTETSLDEFRTAAGDTRDELQNAVDSAREESAANAQPLESAYDELQSAVDDLDSSSSLRDAAETVVPALQQVGTAVRDYVATLGCDANND